MGDERVHSGTRLRVGLDKGQDVGSAMGQGVPCVGHSKNETSKREISLNGSARDAFRNRADELRYTERCTASGARASTPLRPAQAGGEVNGRLAAGVGRGRPFRLPFQDQRHTVVTSCSAGEPEYVIQAVTGQPSEKVLEHYSLNGRRQEVRCSRGWRRGGGGRRGLPEVPIQRRTQKSAGSPAPRSMKRVTSWCAKNRNFGSRVWRFAKPAMALRESRRVLRFPAEILPSAIPS